MYVDHAATQTEPMDVDDVFKRPYTPDQPVQKRLRPAGTTPDKRQLTLRLGDQKTPPRQPLTFVQEKQPNKPNQNGQEEVMDITQQQPDQQLHPALIYPIHRQQTTVVVGDILELDVDVIVNAANTYLHHGGGIDGHIRKAAGPELDAYLTTAFPSGVRTGQAVISDPYNIKKSSNIKGLFRRFLFKYI